MSATAASRTIIRSNGVHCAALDFGAAFTDPQRIVPPDERLRDDVELKLMRELVDDEAVELIGRLVDRHDHPLADRFGERADAFLSRRRVDVLLLELAVRLEQNQLNLERQVVLQVGADLLVRAFRVAGDARQVLFDLRVVVDLEVVRRVDVPLEVVVVDLVLPEVRDERRLRGRHARVARRGRGRSAEPGRTARKQAAGCACA